MFILGLIVKIFRFSQYSDVQAQGVQLLPVHAGAEEAGDRLGE